MTNMSSKMMSSESPPSASHTVISEVHDSSPSAMEYSSAATLRLPHRRRSNSSAEDDKSLPGVGFIDPAAGVSPPVTVAPARPSGEDDITELPISVATQTEVDVALTHQPVIPAEGTPPKLEENEDCGMTCLYYALQCCDCAIM